MKQFLHIKLKGTKLLKLCSLIILGITLACCFNTIKNLKQPTSAMAGDGITIAFHDTLGFNVGGTGTQICKYVVCVLMPKGWNAAENITSISYTSNLGDGTMSLIPNSVIEPDNGKGYNWPTALKAKFKLGLNIVDDVEWVAYQSNQLISIPNVGSGFKGDVIIKMKVGADGNTTIVRPAYLTTDSQDGLSENLQWKNGNFYSIVNGPVLTVNSTTGGDISDLYNPQLVSIDPPKALDNDFITLTYNNQYETTHILGNNPQNVYLCVDSVFTSDGKILTNFCTQSPKSLFKQTSANSGLYKLTIWPQSYFGLTGSPTVTKIIYHITDDTGTKRVGFNSGSAGFIYKFKCT